MLQRILEGFYKDIGILVGFYKGFHQVSKGNSEGSLKKSIRILDGFYKDSVELLNVLQEVLTDSIGF